MKLAFKDFERVISFTPGVAIELVIENKGCFFKTVSGLSTQIEGEPGDAVLSIGNKPVELSRYADIILQFAPFSLNRKALLTKLTNAIEKRAVSAELYMRAQSILSEIESLVQDAADDFPFEIDCSKIAIGPILRSIGIEVSEDDKSTLEKIINYMEIVRELDKDRLFIMVNMRTYFSDDEMSAFVDTACLHDFKVLLLESATGKLLKNTKRYTVDEDLCEF